MALKTQQTQADVFEFIQSLAVISSKTPSTNEVFSYNINTKWIQT